MGDAGDLEGFEEGQVQGCHDTMVGLMRSRGCCGHGIQCLLSRLNLPRLRSHHGPIYVYMLN